MRKFALRCRLTLRAPESAAQGGIKSMRGARGMKSLKSVAAQGIAPISDSPGVPDWVKSSAYYCPECGSHCMVGGRAVSCAATGEYMHIDCHQQVIEDDNYWAKRRDTDAPVPRHDACEELQLVPERTYDTWKLEQQARLDAIGSAGVRGMW